MREHDYEPVPGLPERLPRGERILWQGAPAWRSLALRAFHIRKIAIYFGLLIAWQAGWALAEGATAGAAITTASWLALLGAIAVGVATLFAYLYGRTTLYTITNRRLVMRFGLAMPMTINIPFQRIKSAAISAPRNGIGDIPVTLMGADRIAYLHLWPNARPWRLARPEPMLRSVPDAAEVGEILAKALAGTLTQPKPQLALVPDEKTPDDPPRLAAAG